MHRLAAFTLTLLLLTVVAGRTEARPLATERSCGEEATQGKLALVLGGGGAKGAAHVGVLKVLEEAGVQPDIIVGTSIGAIVGGLYSIGYSASQLDSLFRSRQWLQLFTREAIEGNAIKQMLDSLTARRPPPLPLPVREGSDYSPDNAQQAERHSTPLPQREGQGGGSVGGGSPVFACVASDLPTFSEVVAHGRLAGAQHAGKHGHSRAVQGRALR